ncbi:MAG: DUF3124 domain-containing protein [Ardenticatenaceae bacterium]|nr:DUF3124 domain-containing protein [Ardenticatenaceae bacterium]
MFWLAGCGQLGRETPDPAAVATTVSIQDLDITTGQTIYVPAYSEIYYDDDRTLELAVTLTIHNTDFEHAIVLSSVRYYDTQGHLIHEYLSQPQQLAPLATADFLVSPDEQSGGIGTNFIVEWVAEEAVYEPIVEAIMISTTGAQGISFTSSGRVIRQIK